MRQSTGAEGTRVVQYRDGVRLYLLHNECNKQSIVYELTKILDQARKEEKEQDKEFSFADNDIPLMSTRILMPKVSGQDTSMYDD